MGGQGHDKDTLEGFFDLLGEDRCAQIRLVSCDAGDWIGDVVRLHCKNANICLDAFHLVRWVTDALDEVRRQTWNEARRAGMHAHARDLKHARYALRKNPEDLTARQQAKLAWVSKVNRRLYHACLLNEQFRAIIAVKGRPALVAVLTLGPAIIAGATVSNALLHVGLAETTRHHRTLR